MRVAVYHNNHDLRLEELPKPEIKDGEILVKVLASGICGTDVMEWYRIKKAPRVLGHEITGEIVESKTKKFGAGGRVFVSHHVPCNKCKYCLANNHTACDFLHSGNYFPGGFSEFVKVPKANVDLGTYLLPDNVSSEEGTMVEPLACTLRAQRIIDVKKDHTVLILGSGVSGILNIQVAKLKGAKVIATDIEGYKLTKARQFGADEVIDASQDIKVKADRIIICTGAELAVKQAFNCIDKKGIILFFAIPKENFSVPIVDFWRNEITITSSYGAAPFDLEEALALIQNKDINVKELITHQFSLQDIQKGFEIASVAKESLKVIITFN